MHPSYYVSSDDKITLSVRKSLELLASVSGRDIICFDTETTGLSPNDRIVQISVVDGYLNIILNELINPKMSIPPESSSIHKITNEMVKGKHYAEEYENVFRKIFSGKIVVGYNVFFDLRMLYQSTGKVFTPLAVIDIIQIAPLFLEPIAQTRWVHLREACDNYGIKLSNAHNSLDDTVATMKLTQAIVERYKKSCQNG